MNVTLGDIFSDLGLIVPEVILIATLCSVILADVMLPREKSRHTAWIALAGMVLALLSVGMGYGAHSVMESVRRVIGEDGAVVAETFYGGPQFAFSRMIVIDKLSDFFKVIFLLGTIGVVLFSMTSVEIKDYRHGEYYALLLSSLLGGAFLVSSNNFLMFVLALETLSLSSYVLAGYIKHNRHSAEASLKYILYGSVATGIMLFGISYIYGMTGTLDISQTLYRIPMGEDSSLAMSLAFILLLGGLGFKMAAVPFHFWCPDVYQGAPTPITAFLSVVSKAAGFSAAFRIFLPLFAVEGAIIPDSIAAVRGPLLATIEYGSLPLLFWVLSVSSMTLGNLVAIRQSDIKRMFAYSSIAHAGYILMGMTVFNNEALEAMLFYFFVYLFTNLGAFLVIIIMVNKTGSSSLESYRGLAWKNPFMAVMMFVFLISLTGLPPTAGFIGKLQLFQVVIGAGATAQAGAATLGGDAMFYYSLALIGGLNTVVSLYYYMRITQLMVFSRPKVEGPMELGLFDRVYLLAYFVPVLFLIINFGPVLSMVRLFQR